MSIMLVMMLMVLLAFIGTAVDLGQLYNRRTDLQNLADGAALAAATRLNGTSAGIASAVAAAAAVAASMKYQYGRAIAWDNAAIRFSASPGIAGTPDANWLDVGGASAAGVAADLMYVEVDTGALDPALGLITLPFLRALNLQVNGAALDSLSIGSSAVAGRSAIPVTPLGVCALDAVNPVTQRTSGALVEAIQWGFRRGVNYNLLDLSPAGPTTALNFLVDPINHPTIANFAIADVAPFVCSGTMPMARVPNTMRVQFPFPTALIDQLNSRFDVYPAAASSCDPVSAPPDNNVREYLRTTVTPPQEQTAINVQRLLPPPPPVVPETRVTVAELAPGNPPPHTSQYGVLSSYAMAAKWVAGNPDNYPSFVKGDWSTLYRALSGPLTLPMLSYPATLTPYNASGSSNYLAPSHTGVARRRVLNLPLLACPDPVGGNYSTAAVLAIGQFFMSAKASAAGPTPIISGEFAGILPLPIGTTVRLYR